MGVRDMAAVNALLLLVIGGLAALTAWFARRYAEGVDRRLEDHERRLRAIENAGHPRPAPGKS